MSAFDVGEQFLQGWKRGWRKGLVAAAPQEKSRLSDAGQVMGQVVKRARDVVNPARSPLVIQRRLIADMLGQDV